MATRTSFIHKTILTTLAVCLLISLLNVTGDRYRPPFLSSQAQAVLSFGMLALIPVLIAFWHKTDRKSPATGLRFLTGLQSILIYCISAIFFRFALLKLLNLHMTSSLVYNDMPAGSLTGYQLMDYFFGRAPVFKILLAGLQAFGATCLLFRRTRVIGIATLMPVVANIALMDFFYNIGISITIVALVLALGLAYLISQDLDAIKTYLRQSFRAFPKLRLPSRFAAIALRISAVAIPALLLIPHYHPYDNVAIAGKYNVSTFPSVATALQPDSIPTTIYFDENDDCIFRYSSYDRLKVGKAIYKPQSRTLAVHWRYPKEATDTLKATFSLADGLKQQTLTGFLGGVPVNLLLTKVDLPGL